MCEHMLPFKPPKWSDAAAVHELTQRVRRKVLKRLARMGAMPRETVRDMLAWPHGGFSLNGEVRFGADDRAGLTRLLLYCLRPAVSLKRLSYERDSGRVLYRMLKRRPGDPAVFRWTPLAFIKRLAPIIAPPRLNLVRYVGALGPRAKLRRHVTAAAREEVKYVELLGGVKVPVSPLAASVRKASRKTATAASRAWASCLKKIFAHERQRIS